jgi:hypothetical protein
MNSPVLQASIRRYFFGGRYACDTISGDLDPLQLCIA